MLIFFSKKKIGRFAAMLFSPSKRPKPYYEVCKIEVVSSCWVIASKRMSAHSSYETAITYMVPPKRLV